LPCCLVSPQTQRDRARWTCTETSEKYKFFPLLNCLSQVYYHRAGNLTNTLVIIANAESSWEVIAAGLWANFFIRVISLDSSVVHNCGSWGVVIGTKLPKTTKWDCGRFSPRLQASCYYQPISSHLTINNGWRAGIWFCICLTAKLLHFSLWKHTLS
jgi:hypothetical protein